MTCEDDTHVFLVGSLTCQCGVPKGDCEALVFATQPYPLSGGVIPGYTPHGFAPPRPPTAGAAPPVNIRVFRAAQLIGSHLSADGSYVYTVRYGKVLQAEWKGSGFGAWLDIGEEMPAGAVAM